MGTGIFSYYSINNIRKLHDFFHKPFSIYRSYQKDTIEVFEPEDMNDVSAIRLEVDFGPTASTIGNIIISAIKKVIENNIIT